MIAQALGHLAKELTAQVVLSCAPLSVGHADAMKGAWRCGAWIRRRIGREGWGYLSGTPHSRRDRARDMRDIVPLLVSHWLSRDDEKPAMPYARLPGGTFPSRMLVPNPALPPLTYPRAPPSGRRSGLRACGGPRGRRGARGSRGPSARRRRRSGPRRQGGACPLSGRPE